MTDRYYVKDPSGNLTLGFKEKSVAIAVAKEKNRLCNTEQFAVVELKEEVVWDGQVE